MIAFFASTLLLSITSQDVQLPHHTFADNTAGWTLMGTMSPSAKVSVSHDAAHTKVGSGSLRFDYNVAKGETNILTLPVTVGSLAKMKSLKFWVQSDYATTMAVILQEHGGGAYMSKFAAPKDKWQKAELSVSDFSLNSGPNDPKDPDNRLDMDQVEAISIIDLGFFFAQGDGPMATLFGVVMGPHALYLSDFQASTDALAEASSPSWIDSYIRPQIQWIGIGTPNVVVAASPALDGAPALKLTYKTTAGLPTAIIRGISPGQLSSATDLAFKVASQKAIKLLVQVEESDGGKYNTIVDVAGNSSAQQISVRLADFKPADDSKDANGKLDPELINQLLLVDLSGMAEQLAQDNTLWIGRINLKKP